MAAPLTDDERQAILDLIDEGLGRNEIARRVERGVATISSVAEEAGRTFDRSATKTATQARWADLAAKRTQLAADLLEDAARLRQQLWEPCVEKKAMVVGDGMGLSHVEIIEIHRDEPPYADKQRIMTMAAIAIDKSIAIEVHDSPDQGDLSDVEAFSDWMLGDDEADAA